jgi:hypothetical protein
MRIFSARLCAAALAPLAIAAPPDTHPQVGDAVQAIVGVHARSDAGHVAVVSVQTGGGSLCSGTIIDKSADGKTTRILTAAHCCRGGDPPRTVVLGSDYEDSSRQVSVSHWDRHPCYNGLSNDYDFCLVETQSDTPIAVTPIPLASAPDNLGPGSRITAVGYGSTPGSNTLRRVVEGHLIEVHPLTIAVDQRQGRGGICFGDSGGPMLITQNGREVVAGVTSFGAPTSLCNIIGAGGRVTFAGVRALWLDKLLAGQKPDLRGLLVRRSGISLGPVRDTYLASDMPDQNFGDRVDLLVGSPPGSSAIRRALVRFDLLGVPGGAMLLTARVGFHQESRTGKGTLRVHRVTKEWDERQETWRSFGSDGFDPTPVAAVSNATAVTEATDAIWFDVTPLAETWLSGEQPNYGIMIREPDREQSQLLSSEIGRGSERPWLHVCYSPGGK